MTWQAGDLFECANLECKSKVLILQPPQSATPTSVAPRCVCGQILERVPYGMVEPLRTWTF